MEDSFVTEGSDGCLENEDLRAKTSKTKTQKLFAAALSLINVWLYWRV